MSFEATHRVGAAPIRTWPTSDQSQAEGPQLDPGLEVELVEQQGSMARIACSNGWEAWVQAAEITPLAAPVADPPPAFAGPPPPPASAPTAAAPPGSPSPSAPAAAGQRPAWLLPAIAVGVIIAVIAIVAVVSGGDDAKPAASVTTTTARSGSTETTVVANDVESVLPSTATLASAGGGSWDIETTCVAKSAGAELTGGADCDDSEFGDGLCNDQGLDAPDPDEKAVSRAKGNGAQAFTQVRLYESGAAAESVLDEVNEKYFGPCDDFETGTVFSPTAVFARDAVPEGGFVAAAEIDTDDSDGTDPPTNHLWVRYDRILVSFAVVDGEDLPGTFLRDLAQSAAANARVAQ